MELIRQHLPRLALDVLRLCIWLLLLMLIFVPLEKLFSLHKQKIFRKAFFTDIFYYFLNGLLPKFLLVAAMTLIAWGVHRVRPEGMYEWVATLPVWMRLAAAIVVGEVGFYWGHRWMHEVPFLWRFHEIHHSAEEVDWLVNTRAHPVDLVFVRLCGFVPMYLLGLAQPTGNSLDLVPMLVLLGGVVWGFFIHANVRLRFGWLEWLISTPGFHHWHHTKDGPEYVNKNYAAMLPWVDKCFGTFYLPKKQWPGKYGVEDPIASGVGRQLLEPFAGAPPAQRSIARLTAD
jgi:sterol desaturase/sphingolipid hydroxylase (fatty acid hydroxylase superfamily)